jgi:hypothetical protein
LRLYRKGRVLALGLWSQVRKHNLTVADPQPSAAARPLQEPQGAGHPARTGRLWFQAVAIAQFSRCLQVFSRSHQLSDLPDMSQIVHGPLIQHLLQGDFAGLLMPRAAFTGASRQGPQILHVALALLCKMVEGGFCIGIAVQLQVHLRIVQLELQQFLTHEAVHAYSIAVALGVGKMREHFCYRKAFGRGLPFGIFDRQVSHQSAQDRGGRFQLVGAV